MAYVQKNNPVPKTGCGRRRLSGMKNPFKSKELKSVSKELKKASNTHAGQAEKIDKYLDSSPAKLQKITPGRTRKLAVSRGPARGSRLKVAKTDPEALKRKRKISPSDLDSRNRQKPNTSSPMKGKLKPCQKAAAKRKFKVYPSAYANMWASNHKC